MIIHRTSQFTGKKHSMDIPVTVARISAWRRGEDPRLIQDAFPELTPDQRKFLLTGATPEEWEELFKDTADKNE